MRQGRWAGLLALAAIGACSTPPPALPPPVPPPVAALPDTAIALPEPDLQLPPAPAAPVRAALPVRLAFVGDINLGTTTLPDGVPADDGRHLLRAVDSLLRADLVVGNFEGVLADTGRSPKCELPPRRRGGPPRQRPNCYAFLTPSRLAPRLAEAGFTHLNLANNHANDMGVAGRRATEQILAGLGLRTYGPLGAVSLDTVRTGDSLTVTAVVGFATYPYAPNLLDLTGSAALVDSIRQAADLVIVTFHGGAEGSGALNVPHGEEFLGREPRGNLRAWARAVIDAGADLVVGHGPHVLRGMEFYRGKLIAYSLGNFLTYRGFNLSGPLGLTAVLQVELAGDGTFRSGRVVPLRQPPRQGPEPDPDGAALELMNRLSREDFGPTAALIGPDGSIRVPH